MKFRREKITIYYQYSNCPGVIHETYAWTEREADEIIKSLRNSGYGAWIEKP